MESIRIRIEFEAHGNDETVDPTDLLDCESEEEVYQRVAEWAEETASWGAYPNKHDIAELWEAVQKAKESEE